MWVVGQVRLDEEDAHRPGSSICRCRHIVIACLDEHAEKGLKSRQEETSVCIRRIHGSCCMAGLMDLESGGLGPPPKWSNQRPN